MSAILKNEAEKSFTDLIVMLSSIEDRSFNKVPFEGSWSPAQLADHLFKSYDVVKVLQGRTVPAPRPIDEKVQDLRDLFLNFDIKMESPEFILPSNDPIDKEQIISGIKNRSSAMLKIAAEEDLSELCLDFELPLNGHLTRYEWISFATVHTIRHNHQLKNMIRAL